MEILTVPCDYIEARTITNDRAFWVTLYLIIQEDGVVHSFRHSSDMIDNLQFALECGHKVYNSKIQFLCNKDFMPSLFNEIISYENVLKSSGVEKPKRKYTFAKH